MMLRHLVRQRPALVTFGQTAARMALGALRPREASGEPEVPGPAIALELPPRPRDLVRDYVREVGGDPGAYRATLPPHLFCQWAVPLANRTVWPLPYPMARMLNGGCRLEVRGPIPADAPLIAAARLERVDDDGRRAVLVSRVTTGTAGEPELWVADMTIVCPLEQDRDRDRDQKAAPRERARVGADADELAYWRIDAGAGRRFAALTGDVNPIHWSARYARMFGFKRTILHGFATFARAWEGLVRGRLSKDTAAITALEARFTRPLVLPGEVGLYLEDGDGGFSVGAAPGGPAYMTGRYEA